MTTEETTALKAYSAPIVSKAMRVLKLIITAPRNPGISQIAATLNLAKSTTHGILAALEESGWVLRDPVTRKYTSGHAVKHLADIAGVRVPLVEKARPHLEVLAAQLDEDVFLGSLTGQRILVLDHVESTKELKVTARPGTRFPMFLGAVGKLFLAYQEPDVVDRILKTHTLPQHTPKSVTDPVKYLKDLEKVRKDGFALDFEEYIPNMRAVAVPIFYGRGNRRRMVAGVWIVGLDWHLRPGKMDKAAQKAAATADIISGNINTNYS